jgi:hypothetical protein
VRPTGKWEKSVKMDLNGTVCEDVEWIQLTQDRAQWWALVDTVKNLRVLKRRGIS